MNAAVVNEDANTIMLRKLAEEIEMLRAQVAGGFSVSSMAPTVLPVTVEQAEELEAQREQLAESEKLLNLLNESWEEKLLKTEAMQQARLDKLQAHGILMSQDGDAAVPLGVMAPQRTPYLLNVGRTIGGQCLVYYLHPGATVVMPCAPAPAPATATATAPGGGAGVAAAAPGSGAEVAVAAPLPAEEQPEKQNTSTTAIVLPGCVEDHCIFRCTAPTDDTAPMQTALEVPAREAAAVLLNGAALSGVTVLLRSGDTVTLAQSTFRYAAPGVAAFPTPQKATAGVAAMNAAPATAAAAAVGRGGDSRARSPLATAPAPAIAPAPAPSPASPSLASAAMAACAESPETPLPPAPLSITSPTDATDATDAGAKSTGGVRPTTLDLDTTTNVQRSAATSRTPTLMPALPSFSSPLPAAAPLTAPPFPAVSTPRSTAAAEVTAPWAVQASPLPHRLGGNGGVRANSIISSGGVGAAAAAMATSGAEEPATPAPVRLRRDDDPELAKRMRDSQMCYSTTRPLPTMKVSQEHEHAMVAHLVGNMRSSSFQFALTPAYGLYMLVHSQRRSSEAQLQTLQEHIAGMLEERLAQACRDNSVNELAMLLANASELLAALRTDDALIATSGTAQVSLTGSVQEAFAALLALTKRRCRNALGSVLQDGRAALGDLPDTQNRKAAAGSKAAAPDASIDFLIESLDVLHQLLEHSLVPESLRVQLFSAIFYHIGTATFNQLLADGEKERWLRWDRGLLISYNIAQLVDWATDRGLDLANHLAHTSQAARLLQLNKSSLANLDPLCEAASLLNSVQVERLLRKYKPARGEPKVPKELIDCIRGRAMHRADVLAVDDEMVQCKVQLYRDTNYALPFRLRGPFHVEEGLHDVVLLAEAKAYLDGIHPHPPPDAVAKHHGPRTTPPLPLLLPPSSLGSTSTVLPSSSPPALLLPSDPAPGQGQRVSPPLVSQSSISRWFHGSAKARAAPPIVPALAWAGLQ